MYNSDQVSSPVVVSAALHLDCRGLWVPIYVGSLDKDFSEKCQHEHSMTCDRCNALDEVNEYLTCT